MHREDLKGYNQSVYNTEAHPQAQALSNKPKQNCNQLRIEGEE